MAGWRTWLIIAGGVLVFFGVTELRLNSKARKQAQRITCAKLAESGPGDNAHVFMSEFLLCSGDYIYAEEGGRWSEAWVPAVPLNGAYHKQLLEMEGMGQGRNVPAPRDVRVILKMPKARSDADVSALGRKASIRGMVVNEIESLESDARYLLKRTYPGVDWKKCWIVEVDRRPAGSSKLFAFFGGGIALALVGILALLAGNKQQQLASADGYS